MRVKAVKLALSVYLLAQVNVALASVHIDSCKQQAEKKPGSYEQCLDRATKKLNNELQIWVNNHKFNLDSAATQSGRKSVYKTFSRAHQEFLVFRESNCRWYYLMKSPNPAASVDYQQCFIRLTENRIEELSTINSEHMLDERKIK